MPDPAIGSDAMRPVRAVAFDFNGTLSDDEPILLSVYQEMFAAHGRPLTPADYYGTLVCSGVLAMFTFMIFENIGMTMGIMPVTGIPLPFMSYGGSALVTSCACVALVANVYSRRFS